MKIPFSIKTRTGKDENDLNEQMKFLVNTGTSITGNCYPVISGLVISVVCTTGAVNTGTINT